MERWSDCKKEGGGKVKGKSKPSGMGRGGDDDGRGAAIDLACFGCGGQLAEQVETGLGYFKLHF